MKSFMSPVRHFPLSPFAVISIHILLSGWPEGSVSTAWLCAPAQAGFHSILSSCRRCGARGDITPVIVAFPLCILPLLPTGAHWQCEQSPLAGEVSAYQSQAQQLTVIAITISNLSRDARNPAVLENAAYHARAPRVLSLCRSWKCDL